MEPAVYSNNNAFTLVELMLALFIMMVGLLGLMQTANLAIVHNMTNQLRNGAVLVADQQMTLEMAKPFALISTNANTNVKTIPWPVASTFKNYSVMKIGTNITGSTKNVSVTVDWNYKGTWYTHSINSLLSNVTQ
jgi:type IV pilus assembly protein PilV